MLLLLYLICILYIISSQQMASKLTKNLGPPTSTLHVANLPDDFTHAEVKVRAVVGSLCGVSMPN